MNRWIIILGIVVSGFVLFQFHSGKIETEDVFEMMEAEVDTGDFSENEYKMGRVQEIRSIVDHKIVKIERGEIFESYPKAEGYFDFPYEEKNYYEDLFEKVRNRKSYKERVYGAILPSDLSSGADIAEFFVRLGETQDVKTFVIIGENHSWKGNYNIASSKYGYKTPFGNLEPNINIVNDLEIGNSYYALNNEYSVGIFAPFIKKFFPDARIVPISIKDFEDIENLEELAEDLSEALFDDSVVIASTDFSQRLGDNAARFHDVLSRNVIENFDFDGIRQMDVDSRPSINVLLEYLNMKGAMSAEFREYRVSDSTSRFLITFHEGEAVRDDRDLTILAFGDMMLGRQVRVLMDIHGKDYIFEKIKGDEGRFFEGADVVFGNLEGPIKGQGKKGGTSLNFSFNEDVAPFLKESGFTLVTIANNHALDQGWEGRESTVGALDGAGLGWCGHPSEADYESVFYGKVGDKSYAFLCFQDVSRKLNDEAALELIKTVRPNVDYLIVSIHWGYEYKHNPDWNTEISPGRAFIDAGADFVIGHHPHVVQSFEEYNGRLIFYSLGNFVFDQYWSAMTQEELGIGIVLDDADEGEQFRTKVYLFPMKSEMSQSRLMTEGEYSNFIERFIGYGEYSEEMKNQIRSGIIEINK